MKNKIKPPPIEYSNGIVIRVQFLIFSGLSYCCLSLDLKSLAFVFYSIMSDY